MILNSTKEDFEKIFELYHKATEFQKKKYSVFWPDFDPKIVKAEILENRQWKLVIDNQIACIWMTSFEDAEIWKEKDLNDAIYLHRITTNPEFRGKNLTSKIFEWAKVFAKKNDKKYLRLDTVGENRGLIDLYTKRGFSFLGLTKIENAKNLPSHYHNALVSLFELNLNN